MAQSKGKKKVDEAAGNGDKKKWVRVDFLRGTSPEQMAKAIRDMAIKDGHKSRKK
jgi:hypothetical protein